MKKILKGFTLIELIVVMAILSILMAAIMNMFKPIRETYVDSTLFEAQRTSQNGIIQYVTESVRYATDLGLYTKGSSVDNVTKAVELFADEYLKANGVNITDPANATLRTNVTNEIKKKAEVIIIDNSTDFSFNNDTYHGRILRRKFEKDASGLKPITNDAEDITKKNCCRLALGDAYYGDSDYSITLGVTQDASLVGNAADGIKVTVSSLASYGVRDSQVIATSGSVQCRNLETPINGLFDTTKYVPASSTGSGTKVYIVYINEKIDVTP